MRIKKKSRSRRIKEAVIKDGVNYIAGLSGYATGLSWIPFPLEVLEELLRMRREKSPSDFVDWQLEDWPQIYINELNSVVKLPYRDENHLLPQVLIFNNIERKLGLSQIGFKLKEKPFELKDNIRALTEDSFEQLLKYLREKKRYSNEENLRLVNILERGKKVEFEVQPVEYKYYVHTNLVLDAKSKGKDQTLREYLHSDGRLEELNDSPLANNLGVNMLLFTSDGSLVLQIRSKSVAFRTGELCSSASGTISLTDVLTDTTLRDMPKLREAFEELGVKKSDVPKDQISLLAITRELIRGGEPEMFIFAKMNLSEKELLRRRRDARDKWEAKNLVFFHFGKIAYEDLTKKSKVHGFLCKVDEFIDKYIEESSIPLLTNLALWVEYRLEQNRDK